MPIPWKQSRIHTAYIGEDSSILGSDYIIRYIIGSCLNTVTVNFSNFSNLLPEILAILPTGCRDDSNSDFFKTLIGFRASLHKTEYIC